jgi:hypothetical protein
MIVNVKNASFRMFHGGDWQRLAPSVAASNGLRDHFPHRLGASEIFIDELGPEQAILAPSSRIIGRRDEPICAQMLLMLSPALFPLTEMEAPDR